MIIDLPPAEYRATCFIYSTELVADIMLVFTSLVVLRSVFRCSVIHMNLRVSGENGRAASTIKVNVGNACPLLISKKNEMK